MANVLRLDRLLTLFFFRPLIRVYVRPRQFRIPILMYHSISDDRESGHPYFWINTSPALFAGQMQYLADHDYQVIPLSTAVEMIKNQTYYLTPASPEAAEPGEERREGCLTQSPQSTQRHAHSDILSGIRERRIPDKPPLAEPEVVVKNSVCREAAAGSDLPAPPGESENSNTSASLSSVPSVNSSERSERARDTSQPLSQSLPQPRYVVLTFDDGYADFYTHALPVLKHHGFTATVFLPTAFIDNSIPGLRGKEHLSWMEVCEMQRQGITLGSHTVDHPQVYRLKPNEIEYQVLKSKETIEDKTGHAVESFCYPYRYPEQNNTFVRGLASILTKHGYKNGVTTRLGTTNRAEDVFSLRRVPVNSNDDPRFFRAKLDGGYDWLIQLQHLYKMVYSIKR